MRGYGGKGCGERWGAKGAEGDEGKDVEGDGGKGCGEGWGKGCGEG